MAEREPAASREDSTELEALFHEIADLPANARRARLEECPEQLRTRLRRLLDFDEVAGPVELERKGTDGSLIGSTIGPYELLETIGEGGMGTVYRAEHRQELPRTVAVKVVKWGMDTAEVVARFRAEREALARMNHPNIAGVYDAGATERGRPYFVMEYVAGGRPITEHCDAKKLTTRERVALFVEVCDAVQHAHQKGIVHRDLKPSNVLVPEDDDVAAPKIIDFGIAKATDRKSIDLSLTGLGELLGTPEYMSPEQATTRREDVDTRTDIYSLGILLYELLTGERPFDFRDVPYDELSRQIRETEPLAPSSRVRSLETSAAERGAEKRRTDLRSWLVGIRGEIDWIVAKATAKDRERRYSSASELASDLRRFLADQPVSAGPPGRLYTMRKFLIRHRTSATAALLVLAAVLLGLVGTTVGLLRAQRAEAVAQREARIAERVTDFLVGLFEVSDPGAARGRKDLTAREVLDRGRQTMVEQVDDEPLVRAHLSETMGSVYRNLGLFGEAEELLEGAHGLRLEHLGPDDPKTLDALEALAELAWSQRDAPAAEPLFRTVYQGRQKQLGTLHVETLSAANDLGVVLREQGKLDEAAAISEQAYEGLHRLSGANEIETIEATANLGSVHWARGRFAEARELFVTALEGLETTLGSDHPETLTMRNNIGLLLWTEGDSEAAASHLEYTLEDQERILGASHLATLITQVNYSRALRDSGHPEEALERLQASASGFREIVGPHHPQTLLLQCLVAELLLQVGRVDDAEELFATTETLVDEHVDPEASIWASRLRVRALFMASRGNKEAARETLEEAIVRLEASLGATQAQTRRANEQLATLD